MGNKAVGPDLVGGKESPRFKTEAWEPGLKGEFWPLRGWILFGPTCYGEEATYILPVSKLDWHKNWVMLSLKGKWSNSNSGEGRGNEAVTGMGVPNVVYIYNSIQFNQAQDIIMIWIYAHIWTHSSAPVYTCVYTTKLKGKGKMTRALRMPWGCLWQDSVSSLTPLLAYLLLLFCWRAMCFCATWLCPIFYSLSYIQQNEHEY